MKFSFDYTPQAQCQRFHESTSRMRVLTGDPMSGKTMAAAAMIAELALSRPSQDILVVGTDLQHVARVNWPYLERFVKAEVREYRWFDKQRREPRCITLNNGTRLRFHHSRDDAPHVMCGISWSAAWFDQELYRADWIGPETAARLTTCKGVAVWSTQDVNQPIDFGELEIFNLWSQRNPHLSELYLTPEWSRVYRPRIRDDSET